MAGAASVPCALEISVRCRGRPAHSVLGQPRAHLSERSLDAGGAGRKDEDLGRKGQHSIPAHFLRPRPRPLQARVRPTEHLHLCQPVAPQDEGGQALQRQHATPGQACHPDGHALNARLELLLQRQRCGLAPNERPHC